MSFHRHLDRIHKTRHAILAAAMAFATIVATPNHLLADDATQGPPVNRIEGKVLDHEGNPVAGVQVGAANRKIGYISYSGNGRLYVYGPNKRILLLFKARNGSASAESLTDANGQFALTNIMDGPVNLAAAHPTHGVAFLEDIDPVKDGTPVTLTLAPPTFATGRVRGIPEQNYGTLMGQATRQYSFASFTPVAPAKSDDISHNLSTAIGPDGHFRIGPLPAGIDEWALAFDRRARNYSATVLRIPVTLSTLTENTIDIDLTKSQTLSGIVRGPKNEPLPDVSITTVRSDGILVGDVSDELGKFKIGGVSEGTIQLEAKRWAKRTAPG